MGIVTFFGISWYAAKNISRYCHLAILLWTRLESIKLTFVHFRCACTCRACKMLALKNSITHSLIMQRSLAKIKDVNICVRSYISFDKHGFTLKIHNTTTRYAPPCLFTMGNPFLTIIARRGMHNWSNRRDPPHHMRRWDFRISYDAIRDLSNGSNTLSAGRK